MENGWSLQDALMIKPVHKVFKDHFGRKFETATDMCRYHGVSYSLYLNRLKSGKSLEEALNPHNKEKYIDHLGNVFNTQKEMCAFHGVSENTYYQRLRAGKTIEEALCKAAIYYKKDSDGKIFCRTKKEKQTLKREWFDHLGNKFSTLDEMCAFHGVERHAFTRDIKKCVSLKEALTPKVSVKVRCTDHLGNEFESITEMCKHHGITLSQYESRKRSDWPLERILSKGDYARRKTCTDHLGNVFESEIKMCQHWGVSDKTYRHRIIYDGWSLEKALTTKDIYTCTDHLGNVYKSKVEMAEHWGQKKGVRVEFYSTIFVQGWKNNM